MQKKYLFRVAIGATSLLSAHISQAQSIERQVIGAAGSFQTASWGSLSSTSGEAVVSTLTAGSNVLTQGFQQPLISDVMVYDIVLNNFSVQVYPNPASDIINVVINTNNADKHYSVTVFDLPGQRLDIPSQDISNGKQTHILIDIHQLAAATYMIMVADENNKQVKAIKFTKNN
jgi:hypothetical protein